MSRKVAHWPLNESSGDALDWSGNEYHGIVNGATQGVAGVLQETAYSFGGDDYISVSTDDIEPTISVSMWLKSTNASSSGYVYLLNTSGQTFIVEWSSSDGNLAYYDGSHHPIGSNPSDGEWHHIVWLLDNNSGTGEIFVNGVSIGSDTFSANSDSFTTIGSISDGTRSYYDGQMQDLRIYDRILTPAEIRYMYETSKTAQFVMDNKEARLWR